MIPYFGVSQEVITLGLSLCMRKDRGIDRLLANAFPPDRCTRARLGWEPFVPVF